MSGLGDSASEVLLDTDVFIDHIRGARRIPLARPGAYSIVTRAVLFSGSERDEPAIHRLLEPLRELVLDRAIAERAGRLRRLTGLRTPDALIAATALEYGLELVTRNHRDFARVKELRVRDPSDLATEPT